jgi:hypothetical protein
MKTDSASVTKLLHGLSESGIITANLATIADVELYDTDILKKRIEMALRTNKANRTFPITTDDLEAITNLANGDLISNKDNVAKAIAAFIQNEFPGKDIRVALDLFDDELMGKIMVKYVKK